MLSIWTSLKICRLLKILCIYKQYELISPCVYDSHKMKFAFDHSMWKDQSTARSSGMIEKMDP